MCGFAGILSLEDSLERSDKILEAMGQMFKYRGPDEQKIYQDAQISFVFRRLAIVDLENGSQPIWDKDKKVFIAVNGEIYNHKELRDTFFPTTSFLTNSDAEVVLHLYLKFGTSAFEKLNGMFAISIWDTRNNELILARDRLGIKPLYYFEQSNGLVFGSELKSLLAHPSCPRTLNWEDLQVPGVQDKPNIPSYIKNIHHFPAGNYAKYSLRSPKKLIFTPYWTIDEHLNKNVDISASEANQKYFQLVQDSLEKRLMSDVPVGLFLSGGIDSSILASLAAKSSKKIHCFTVLESATYHSGDAKIAKKVCEDNGLEFHPIVFSLERLLKNFNLAKLEQMIAMMESPRFDLEWYYKSELHKAAKALVPDIKVIILGQGADEFAGGYSNYLNSKFDSWSDYIRYSVEEANAESELRAKLVPERLLNCLRQSSGQIKLVSYKEKMRWFSYQLQHFNLWHEDRTSSFYGLESRVPFLDHRVVEFLASLPESLHEELFWNKNIVRNCAKKTIANYPVEHPKVPFFVTDENTAITDFAIGACKNIYHNFEEKYKNASFSCPINWKDTNQLYINSQKNNSTSGMFAWQLIEVMSIVIFQNFCSSPYPYLKDKDHDLSDHYPELELNKWNELESIFGATFYSSLESLDASSIVNIPESCEILNPLTEEEGKTALALLCDGKQLSRIEIPDSYMWIVMLLDEMGRHINAPKSIGFWADKVQVSEHDIIPIIKNLVSGGFLTLNSTLTVEL
jgi:asparagine synthase (glutamine-hydrolysing)